MPNVGLPELFILLIILGLPVVFGYWCYKIFERKGMSRGAGFAVGFVPAFMIPVLGGAVAVVVSYLLPGKTRTAAYGQGSYPPPPPPPS
jgi:hypothetical protein